MSLLDKLLSKRGIQHVEELDTEEKAVFDRYASVLRGDSVTIESIKEFCKGQIALIEAKFASNANPTDDIYLKACLHVYLNLLKAIEAPEAERDSLEKYLVQLLSD